MIMSDINNKIVKSEVRIAIWLLNGINFTIDEEDALSELDVNNANGPDKIGNAFLKNLSKSLPKSLHLLFNLIANKAII